MDNSAANNDKPASTLKMINWREVLSAVVWGIAVVIGSYHTHTELGLYGAFAGGLIGCISGFYISQTRLRSITITIGAILAYILLSTICSWQINSTLMAMMVGIDSAYLCYDACHSFCSCLCAVTALHALSCRHQLLTVLEVIVLFVAVSSPLAGHRNGFICRPFELVDLVWSRGYDPIPFFKAFGILTIILFIGAITGRSNRRNTMADMSLLVLTAIILGSFAIPNVMTLSLPKQQSMKESGESSNKETGQSNQPQDQNGDSSQPPPQGSQNNDQNNNNNNKDKENPEPQPVAVVVFYQDFQPQDNLLHFRQSALSYYNGKRLVEAKSTDKAYDTDIASGFPQISGEQNVLQPIPVPTEEMASFKPVTTRVCLITDHPLPFGLLTPQSMTAVNNPNSNQFVRAYQVQSLCYTEGLLSLLDRSVGEKTWDKETWLHYLAIPKDERYSKLANSIVGELSERYEDMPVAKVGVCASWLAENCTYDPTVKILDKEDPAAKFLFGDRIGYCVHLAHSMAYLARALGVPSRVATGYMANSRGRYGGSSLLITSDRAHAWCEIYISEMGWYPIEITPSKTRNTSEHQQDPELQKMLGQLARKESGKADDQETAPRNIMFNMQDALLFIGKALVYLAILLTFVCCVIKIARRLAPLFTTMPQRIDADYRAALDCLADVGVRRHYGEAREDFATRYYDQLPALRQLTDLHMRKSLGDPKQEPKSSGKQLNELFTDFKRQYRQQFPLWKRCLGALNPFSWLLTK